jgi:hypothetical protein
VQRQRLRHIGCGHCGRRKGWVRCMGCRTQHIAHTTDHPPCPNAKPAPPNALQPAPPPPRGGAAGGGDRGWGCGVFFFGRGGGSIACFLCAAAALSVSVSEAPALGRPRRSPATWAAGAGGRRQRSCGPLLSRPLPPAPQGCATVLCFSPLSTARPAPGAVAKRALVLGAGVHVGQQARGFVFVEAAPCPCGLPLSCAVPLVRCCLFGL